MTDRRVPVEALTPAGRSAAIDAGSDVLVDEPALRGDSRPTASPQLAVPGNTGRRMEDLEGYRGLAAFGVVVFHAYQFTRQGPGAAYAYEGTWLHPLLVSLDALVNLFFVLSAVLLYLPIARRLLEGQPAPAAGVFLSRRAIRILPLYVSAVVIVWAFRNPVLPGEWRDLLEHLTFTHVFDTQRIFWTIGPAWSLAVEIYFYVLLAAIIAVLGRTRAHRLSRRARVCVAWAPIAGLITVSGAHHAWALSSGVAPEVYAVWFSPLAKAYMFGLGMALAVVVVRRGRRALGRPALVALQAAAGVLLVAAALQRHPATWSTALFHLLTTVAFTALLASSVLAPRTAWWRRVLGSRRMQSAGLISYSVYLWHEPLLLLMYDRGLVTQAQADFWWVALVLVATSAVVGWVSYWVIEYPPGRLRVLRDANGRRRDFYQAALVPAVHASSVDGAAGEHAPGWSVVTTPGAPGSTTRG
ncbi:acyltransferase family protein [Georgenia sp. AZ-5]|uniref:acyltransferase family protein n=1 Tax=Georgenia sp. AZ-5 TaxID=3367526 RepID=UPI003754AC94